jgi:diguanylate cyclase (GGDEF)-like protein
LRHAMFVRMAVLVVGALAVAAWALVVLGLRPVMENAARAEFAAASARVVAPLDTLATTTRQLLFAGQDWWSRQSPTVDDPAGFNAMFMPLLAADPFATSVVAGTEAGQGWLLLEQPDGRWRNRLTDVGRWGTTQHILVHEPGKPAVPGMQTQDYDARARPWYQVGTALGKATDVGWTSPYRFLSTGDPGISAAVQLTRPDGGLLGVLGVDLKLADLSAVTAAAKVGQHGVALMLTDDNLVLALPRAPAGTDLARWSTLVMQPVDTLALPAVTAAVNHWVAGGRQPLAVEAVVSDNVRWLVSATPYQLGAQRWWVLAMAPASDFAVNWKPLAAWGLVLLVVLMLPVGWLARDQARRIVRPLEALAADSQRFGQLLFDQPAELPPTNVVEVRQLAWAHEQARQLLLSHQQQLDEKIHALEHAQTEIHKLAFFDPLTQLPNRRLFLDRLTQALSRSDRGGQVGALLFIDLDNFKTLNDTLGHAAGDSLLQLVAQRLQRCVRQSDTVSRFGGDEFLVMLEDLAASQADPLEAARKEARLVAQKVLTELGQPAHMLGAEYVSTPSIGVVLFQGRENADDLLKWADMAMYQAKASGRNALRFFDPDFQSQAENRVQIEGELRKALRGDSFQMWLQPQFDRERNVVGAEALLRWPHASRGWISPAEFIPVAESSGLIVVLGQWVLEQACKQLALWALSPQTAGWTLSVNVSARQFRHPDFVTQTFAMLARHGAPAERLRLELTESMLFDDVAQTIERMATLRAHGLGFSLDDFGTGYSSLSYLKQLPFAELKIDQSFVRDMVTDPSDAVLTRTMIALAHALGLGVLAEGVETEEQFAALSADGCDLFQGYLLGRPLDTAKFEAAWASVPADALTRRS